MNSRLLMTMVSVLGSLELVWLGRILGVVNCVREGWVWIANR